MLVIDAGLNPNYVLDDISDVEIIAIMDRLNEKNKREFEIMRQHCYYSVLPSLTNKIDIQNFMPFSWDKEVKDIEVPILKKDEVKERIKQMIKATNNKQNG